MNPNELVAAINRAWEETLGTMPESDDEGFLDVGGNSLLAVRLSVAIADRGLPLLDLGVFEGNPTVGMLHRLVETQLHGEVPKEEAPAVVIGEPLEPSRVEESIWVGSKLFDSRAYIVGRAYRVTGHLDASRLLQSFDQVALATPSLMSAYHLTTEGLRKTHRTAASNGYARASACKEYAIPGVLAEFFAEPFDLTCPPHARCLLVNVAEGLSYVLIAYHHIAVDLTSVNSFLGQLGACYAGNPRWKSEVLQSGPKLLAPLRESAEYWRSVFDTPVDDRLARRVSSRGPQPRTVLFHSERIEAGSRRARSGSLTVLSLAAVWLALRDVSGSTDHVMLVPMDLRGATDATPVGCAIEVVPVRVRGEAAGPAELLEVCRDALHAAHRHRACPVSSTLGSGDAYSLRPDNRWLRVLVDVNQQRERLQLGKCQVTELPVPESAIPFDLQFEFERAGGVVEMETRWRTTSVDRMSALRIIERVSRHLKTVSEQ